MRVLLLVLVAGAVAVLARMSVFTVDPTEFVYLTEFGRHVDTFDGGGENDAGLHFCWPWPINSTRRLDRRLQHLDLPAIELLTSETSGGRAAASSVDKTLTVEAYVCWRISAKDQNVDLFVRSIGTTDRARAILGQRVNSKLGALIGQLRMDDLISTDSTVPDPNVKNAGGAAPTKVDRTMGKLRSELLSALQQTVLDEYGIEIVDVRLKRFNHPSKVRDTIFSRIKSERELKAAHYINEGRKRAEDIRTLAEAKVRMLSLAAEKVEKEVKLEAEVEAEKIRVAAFNQDKAFFAFWQQLEQMKSILGNPKTTLLLSTHRSVFDFMFNVPGPEGMPAVARPDASDRGINGTNPAPKKGD